MKKPFAILSNNTPSTPTQKLQDYNAKPHNFTLKNDSNMKEMEVNRNDIDQFQPKSLEHICHNHETLVNIILQEEEDLLSSHRKYIDEIVESVKMQMMLLHEVDKPGSNVEEYVASLDGILESNVNMIGSIRRRLKTFETHLKEEEELSKKFYEQQVQDDDEDMQQDVDEDDHWEQNRYEEKQYQHYQRQQKQPNYTNDEFMDDLYDLEVIPSAPPRDNLLLDDDEDSMHHTGN